jgi:pimeloyl-ACP methyl ester carboxylesterase
MSDRPCLVFACAHLCDERLFAAQVEALGAAFDCRVLVFREHDSLAGMAESLLASAPERFTLIGLSLGGYVAFEVMRRARPRASSAWPSSTRPPPATRRHVAPVALPTSPRSRRAASRR